MSDFPSRVYTLVEGIPPGKVLGYGQIARYLGAPGAARQVGWAMSRCPAGLPWHRVLRSDGTISYAAHSELQRGLLETEGVLFLPDGRVDMEKCLWNPSERDQKK